MVTMHPDSRKASTASHFKPDPEWLRSRKELLAQIKDDVEARLGSDSADVRAYAKRYEKELSASWKVSSKADLVLALSDADIVYGGDFHALGQSQRTHLKILRELGHDQDGRRRDVALAVECFSIESQKWIDAYLAGKIEIDELYARSNWSETWGFPWENYRPLFEIAYRKGWRILALNVARLRSGAKDLQQREKRAAQVIARYRKKNPSSLVYVIFGDLHLAQNHLPREVRQTLTLKEKRELREVVVHLNSEKIYFQLAKKGLEQTVDVVRFRDGNFCILASPPWVQWQSYLFFLDQTLTADEGDYDGGFEPDFDLDDAPGDFDPTDQVVSLIRTASSDLKLKFKTDDLSVFNTDDQRVWKNLSRQMGVRDVAIARELFGQCKSFYLPKSGRGFLGRSTVNHAASLAGQYIHAKLSGLDRTLWRFPRDFCGLIWAEAAAYFISKLINHKRQSETIHDLHEQLLRRQATASSKEVLKLTIDRSLSELIFIGQGRRRAVHFKPRRKSSYVESARILGGMIGERLYIAYRSRKLNVKDIVKMLKADTTATDFERHYEKFLLSLARSPATRVKSRPERL